MCPYTPGCCNFATWPDSAAAPPVLHPSSLRRGVPAGRRGRRRTRLCSLWSHTLEEPRPPVRSGWVGTSFLCLSCPVPGEELGWRGQVVSLALLEVEGPWETLRAEDVTDV